jgi:hypothetical protein
MQIKLVGSDVIIQTDEGGSQCEMFIKMCTLLASCKCLMDNHILCTYCCDRCSVSLLSVVFINWGGGAHKTLRRTKYYPHIFLFVSYLTMLSVCIQYQTVVWLINVELERIW